MAITGASAGFGAATARQLAAAGFTVVAGARRRDRLQQLAADTGAVPLEVDVRDAPSIERFVSEIDQRFGRLDVLINNAGVALGKTRVESTPDEFWEGMWETNVLGLLRVTRACLPLIRKAPYGHIVNLGSIASFEVYPGGAGYTSTKHAVRAITRTLRLELNGEPIRVSEVAPGMAETEFSLVRYQGDAGAAKNEYRGVQPLTAEDIAEVITFVVTRPPHVDIDEVVIRPVAQAAAYMVARKD
ncbi:MAG TPA: SDR family NAD(P)-dependent oxidoreductase [Candidatus Dormibacteraeota bacterium]